MTVSEFEAANPANLKGALLALWWDAHGDWERAHLVAQNLSTADGAWVHAYLHRKEGDTANASYWYRRASRPIATGDTRSEWEQMVEDLLRR